MKNFRLSRVVASIVAVSLVMSAPGGQAWAQVAASVRAGSAGAGMNGAAGSLSAPSAAPSAITTLSMPSASLTLTSGSPALRVTPYVLSAVASANAVRPVSALAAVPLAAAATPVVAPATVGSAMKAAGPAALTSGLSAVAAGLSAPAAADKKSDGALGRLSSFFDGLVTRRPNVDAVNAAGPGESAARESGLGDPRRAYIPVLVTLADPGSIQALGLVLSQLYQDVGFRLDDSYGAVREPGAFTVRGAIPMATLKALTKAPGVLNVAAASGSIANLVPAAAAPVSAVAPVRENLLRAGLRGLILKSPMWGAVAALPLQLLIAVAFMGPVSGGLALGGAAAVLKPWMLGTAVGMAASFSFLAPLFKWIPLNVRVAATYGAAAGVAWTFYALAPGLPALWLAGNLLVSLLATHGSVAHLAKAGEQNVIEKTVNATESAAFLNILGYQATLPILLLAGMMPLAYGILAVSSLLSLALLIRTRSFTAPVLSVAAPSGPSSPEGPDARNLIVRDAVSAKRPAHEPFVPATRVVAEMEKLLKTDPAAALKLASAAIVNEKERRAEVKIGAQRVLDALPLEQTLPHYLDLLKLTARPGVQTNKDMNLDPWWYLQRTALKRLTRDAAALKPVTPELLDVLKTSYKDRNASVRLAAAAALAALGVEPGPEVSYESRQAPVEVKPAQDFSQTPQGPKKSSFTRWISLLLLGGMIGWLTLSALQPAPAPKAPTAITQSITAPDSAAKIDAPKLEPRDAALEQIAKDTKRTADAAERSAKAAEEMAKPKSNFLMNLAFAILPIFLLVWLMRRMQGGGAGGIQMKPKMNMEKPTTRFDDVAGIDESLVELQELIDFMREPARFKRLGARIPKGILMEGPPGTGKTLLARALAGESNATFISISGSDFVELYVGMGARRVRELFEAARQNGPAIIFIDEIDAVGKKRGDGGPGGGGNDEREQTINQILKEMDGFDNSSGVIVVAATNRADTLDAALTRPGRFDRKIHVGLPEAMGREAILALHAKKARLAAEVDLRLIARRTAGLSGAFLENVINEAALLAARRGGESINGADIDEAVDRATIGGKRSLRLSDALKLRIGRHEVGHVAANLLNENAEVRVPVNKVTIIPHGSGALGFAESGSEEGDKYLYTRAELEARLDTALGGLVAEQIYYGEWSTGPGSDLESATRVARAMVQQLGMSEAMGLAQTMPNQYGQSSFGGEADAKALVEINKLLAASKARVEKRLKDNKTKFEALVAALVEKETLSSDEIEAILHPAKP